DRRLRQRSPRLAARRGRIRLAAGGGARRRRGRREIRSGGRHCAGASMTGRFALNAFVALTAAFLVLPILAIVPAAFSAQSFIRLPPDAWSLRWWGTFFNDVSWRVTLLASLKVAAFTTLICVVAGTSAALGIARSSPRARRLLTSLFLGPVVTPAIVLAVALYSIARSTGLVGTTTALVIAHTMLALPFVVLNVGVSLDGLDRRLLQAAAGLGA